MSGGLMHAEPDSGAVRAIPSSSSLFSRLSPLSKRSKHIFDFTIEPEEPFKTYAPGDSLKGHIALSVLKGFDITHLVIALHGYVKIFKHTNEERDSVNDLVNGKGSKGFEYLGNGLASLFQDEQVLCGSGFLKKQVYKFGFELQFPLHDLPSAIKFERGAISYMISASVTRPITIAPVVTRTLTIRFRDTIDISSMYSSKYRTISLEPVSKRGKVRKVNPPSTISTQASASKRGLIRNNTQITQLSQASDPARTVACDTIASDAAPPSPAPSEDTVDTHATASTVSFQVAEREASIRKSSLEASETPSSIVSARTITAQTEIVRFGALPGDMIPIKVHVTHTKRDVRGVIIATLFRLGRIDHHPVLPLNGKAKDKKNGLEDIYPKFKSGFGGLYFSGTASNAVFRKDLSQSSTMMVVNPLTLTADVHTSVKVPDDAFPTISNVPGGMVSFTYHVEIIIDLTGKLGETRFPSLTNNGPTFSAAAINGNQMTNAWASQILDTSSLRRMKSIVTFELPLIIGTKDTTRVRGKAIDDGSRSQDDSKASNAPYYSENDVYHENGEHQYYDYDAENEYYHNDIYNPNIYYDEYGNHVYENYYEYGQPTNEAEGYHYSQVTVPPPQEEEVGDEKARMRRHEEMLLPSQPPQVGEQGSSNRVPVLTPSAPTLEDTTGKTHLVENTLATPPPMSRSSEWSAETVILNHQPPPLGSHEDMPGFPMNDDKQELERRRLMAQASAPPAESTESASASSVPTAPAATAPVIDEEDEYIARTLHQEDLDSDRLPAYQR